MRRRGWRRGVSVATVRAYLGLALGLALVDVRLVRGFLIRLRRLLRHRRLPRKGYQERRLRCR